MGAVAGARIHDQTRISDRSDERLLDTLWIAQVLFAPTDQRRCIDESEFLGILFCAPARFDCRPPHERRDFDSLVNERVEESRRHR